MQPVRPESAKELSQALQDAAAADDALVAHWLEHRNDVSALHRSIDAGLVVEGEGDDWGIFPCWMSVNRLGKILSVYSHSQALGQCEEYLRSLKGVSIVAYYDTAGAAKMIRDQDRHDAAAVASVRAARTYGLSVLKRNVESNHRNYTRFIVLSRKPGLVKRARKTSLVFAVNDEPGALFKALAVFALREINMLKIESRPHVGKPWEYLFYLDIEGSPMERTVQQALSHLGELTSFVRVLGAYPFGTTIKS